MLTLERVVTHKQDQLQPVRLVCAAGQTDVRHPLSEPEISYPGGTPSGKKRLKLI
jgi:hypothetical protein